MSENIDPTAESNETQPAFAEGVDYYFEDGLLVMTAGYLRRQGYCCNNGCRHCPYDENGVLQ